MPYNEQNYINRWMMSQEEISGRKQDKTNPLNYRPEALENRDPWSEQDCIAAGQNIVDDFSTDDTFDISKALKPDRSDKSKEGFRRDTERRVRNSMDFLRIYGKLLDNDLRSRSGAGEEMRRVVNAINALNHILNAALPVEGKYHRVNTDAVERMLGKAVKEAQDACKAYISAKDEEMLASKRRRTPVRPTSARSACPSSVAWKLMNFIIASGFFALSVIIVQLLPR